MSFNNDSPDCFIPFSENIDGIPLPEKFTFPFYYEPHALSVIAVKQLQDFLENSATSYGWDFWHGDNELGRGRMFGVLVVKKEDGSLGFLAAFSGNTTIPDKGFPFVPSIFDFWDEDDFYRKGERESAIITAEIESLENDLQYKHLQQVLVKETSESDEELSLLQYQLKAAKKDRDAKRSEAENMSSEDFELLKAELTKESLFNNYHFKKTKKNWKERLKQRTAELKIWQDKIEMLRADRKALSNRLHEAIYKGFRFLNQTGETKGIDEVFADTVLKYPPSGAGECAAPRLLQYAFKYQLKIVSMAEFWWGATSKSDIREHKYYYPACHGKCRPILGHMLDGIVMDENPMLNSHALDKVVEVVYEDEHLLVVFKPDGLLSVPGRLVLDSVHTRMQLLFPNTNSPLVVHRLDMDTSGLMLIAKNKEVYKHLQAQFIRRKVKKRYMALLEGFVEGDSGLIELPLMLDFLNRPCQVVDDEHGKSASTRWKLLKRYENRSLVHFFPHTGRTHQLRVHAAHSRGLHCPIVGDDLYGTKDKRLFLHAEWIEFEHPITRERVSFEKKADFYI